MKSKTISEGISELMKRAPKGSTVVIGSSITGRTLMISGKYEARIIGPSKGKPQGKACALLYHEENNDYKGGSHMSTLASDFLESNYERLVSGGGAFQGTFPLKGSCVLSGNRYAIFGIDAPVSSAGSSGLCEG